MRDLQGCPGLILHRGGFRDATARMVATLRVRQLQKDVNEAEEAELRRLENGATAGGDGDRPALPQTGVGDSGGDEPSGKVHEDGSAGVVVAGAKQRAEQLDSKKFVLGGFRDSHKVTGLQPRGGAGLKAKVPKRKDFGDEGDEGDAAHGAAMKELSLADFGCSHVQDRTLRRGVRGEVGTIWWCDAPPVKVRVCTVRGEVREERCERRGWRYSVVTRNVKVKML